MFRERVKRFHFVGIGGIGMSGIAQILLDMGYEVSGSDLKENKNTQLLRRKGAKVYIGHSEENLGDAQVVVYSSAVGEGNPEIRRARERSIPVISRGEMLAELFRLGEGIAVCGSHGKTTTTSMIAHVFHEAGYDPTVLIGGVLQRFGSNAKLGRDGLIISEADESDGSFLKLLPTVAVITNIDREHLGFYSGIEQIKEAFLNFANLVPFYGFVVLNADDENCRWVMERTKKRVLTLGMEREAYLRAQKLRLEGGRYRFEVLKDGRVLGEVHLGVPGRHNVYNALACSLVCLEAGIDFRTISSALGSFRNAERRMELKGYYRGAPLYDDYGHHPTEIEAVLRALRDVHPERKLILVFQPHRYSRTYYLFDDFVRVLKNADVGFLTDVYPAGEENLYGVSAEVLAQLAGYTFCPTKEELFNILEDTISSKDMVVFMGAGNISKWCEEFLSSYERHIG
ncbi:MAG: UDP-N-acetylmuramate--L-alanine ligase [Acidobacteria bacterium]|nr:MAG: UDP-N-acetylmuramate--L-alanine ligase [Acidobacteriota bacterium]